MTSLLPRDFFASQLACTIAMDVLEGVVNSSERGKGMCCVQNDVSVK